MPAEQDALKNFSMDDFDDEKFGHQDGFSLKWLYFSLTNDLFPEDAVSGAGDALEVYSDGRIVPVSKPDDSDEKPARTGKRRSRGQKVRKEVTNTETENESQEKLKIARKIAKDRLKTIVNLNSSGGATSPQREPSRNSLREEILDAVAKDMDLPESEMPAIAEHLQKYGFSLEEIDEMGPQEMYDNLSTKMASDYLIVSMVSSTGDESNFAEKFYHGRFRSPADFEKYEYYGAELADVASQVGEKLMETFGDEEVGNIEAEEIADMLMDENFPRVIEEYNKIFPDDALIVLKGLISYHNSQPYFWPGLSFVGQYGGTNDPNVMVFRLKDSDDGKARTKVTA